MFPYTGVNMDYNRFTLKLQNAIQDAAEQAAAKQHPDVVPAYIIIALAKQKDGVLRPLFEKLGVSPDPSLRV